MSEESKIESNDPGKAIDMVQDTMESFIETADVSKVYGEPILHEDTLIIPAAEVVAALGFGAGYGYGYEGDNDGDSRGGGGGGGGKTFARPVAVVVATKDGVHVEPVVDPTKIAMTFFTALGFMVATISRMKRNR